MYFIYQIFVSNRWKTINNAIDELLIPIDILMIT